MRECLDGAASAEIASANAYYDGKIDSTGLPVGLNSLEFSNQALRSIYRKSLPSEEIVTGSLFALKHIECFQSLSNVFFVNGFFNEGAAAP